MQSYTHFTHDERCRLQEMIYKGMSIRKMAMELCRSPSGVSREIKRNSYSDGCYRAFIATSRYIHRRKACIRKPRLDGDAKLMAFAEESLSKYWSPEIITAKWKEANPGVKLSHSTIYRAFKRGELNKFPAYKYLRRRNVLKYKHKNSGTIKPDHLIAERPEQANKRERIGDWEGDMVHGAIGKGYIVTCIDRKTRYLTAAFAYDMRASTITESMQLALSGMPITTLTLDRGAEFAGFREIEQTLKCTVYFADPHSPWQRGSNENVNGLLRFFFPKGTDFKSMTQEELDFVVDLINSRPRKCLDWLTPLEVFRATCCT